MVLMSSQMSIAETQGTNSDCSSAYIVQADQLVVVLRNLDRYNNGGRFSMYSDSVGDLSSVARVEPDSSRLFNFDQSELRCIVRADMIVPNPAAIARIVGIRAV